MMRKTARNFTLIEVLIVLAILGMLAALVTVPLARHLDGAEVQGAASRVQTTLSDAQAEARESGRPVRVVATVDEQGRTGLACHPIEAEEASPTIAPPDVETSRAARKASAASGMEHAFARATRRVQLPTGVTIEGESRDAQPEIRRSVGGMAASPAVGTGEAAGATSAVPAARTIAIFMPDGSAVVRGPIRVSDREGRSSEVRVNPWTGVAVLAQAGQDAGSTRPSDNAGSARRESPVGDDPDGPDPFAEWR